MNLINYILNRYFIYTNNKENEIKFNNIEEFNSFIENIIKLLNDEKKVSFSDLSENDKIIIKNIIFNYNYPKKLKPIAKKLYEYTDIENLVFCALNLCSIKLEKTRSFTKIKDVYILSDGSYHSNKNYMRYHYRDAIPHEFMHMCSCSVISKNNDRNIGFGKIKNGKTFGVGLNEGYTELLSRRIYYNRNYDGNSYSTNVYSMRILELLYDKQEDMEKDYFRADLENLIKVFLKYASKDELETFIDLMNQYEWNRTKEDKIKLLNLIKNIVKRTTDPKKISKAEKIEEEYQIILSKRR